GKLLAPAAALIKRRADRRGLPFSGVMQAELLVLRMAFITDGWRWYPPTLHYSSRAGALRFCVRAARHRDFHKLTKITGIGSGDELRAAVKVGHEKLSVDRWHNFWISDRSFWGSMNMDSLDTLK